MALTVSDDENELNQAILASDSQDDDDESDSSTQSAKLNEGVLVISESDEAKSGCEINILKNDEDSVKKTPRSFNNIPGWRSVASTSKKKKVWVDLCLSSTDDSDDSYHNNPQKSRNKSYSISSESITEKFNEMKVYTDSDDDDEFEKFLTKVKTPKHLPKPSLHDSSFIVESSDEENAGPEFYLSLRNTPFKKQNKQNSTFKTPKSITRVKGSMTEPKNSKFTTNSRITKEINTDLEAKLSFLASLSCDADFNKCHIDAIIYRKNFKRHKDELVTKLFSLFNSKIFKNQLPSDMEIAWNSRMRKTAGFCYTKRLQQSGSRWARIELAPKVVDNSERLRDTLIHELCHAATWIIEGVRDGHGSIWKQWTIRARCAFPELAPINTCHSYAIHTKFVYKCTLCTYKIGRHSKSIDVTKKCCPYCRSKLQLFRNNEKNENDNEVNLLNSDFVKKLHF